MMDQKLVFMQLSSLHKVFLDEEYFKLSEISGASALKGERVSWQILYTSPRERETVAKVQLSCDPRIRVELAKVGSVASQLPARKDEKDECYLRTAPGLYPDVLYPLTGDSIVVNLWNCHSLFVTAHIPEDMDAGVYPVTLNFETALGNYTKTFTVKVLNAVLPEQELIHTEWFHCDCIASYYKLEPLSEPHWAMIGKFMKSAADMGVNMILTPLFTLALDTEVGRERPTVQLVDVKCVEDGYVFGFDKLKRWVELAKSCGMKYFEMSHLFSQWGTGCPPKIEADTAEGRKKIFGWHTKADSPEYRLFLKQLLPQLEAFLKAEGIWENTSFHISDEPNFEKHYEIYKTEREMLEGLVPGNKIMDAMSHFEFCECGLCDNPVPITCAVEAFQERGFQNLWCYYCCGPCDRGYSNRLMAMPSGRNRILGVQLYKYDIVGFLHWGFNFYYSQHSLRQINPFYETDADEAFQSGDSYMVYPGPDGPIRSLRYEVFHDGLQDLRACKLLERYIGKDAVKAILDEGCDIRFDQFPRTDDGVLAIRTRINNKLEEVLA